MDGKKPTTKKSTDFIELKLKYKFEQYVSQFVYLHVAAILWSFGVKTLYFGNLMISMIVFTI